MRWEPGYTIDWELFEEKSGNVVNYKGHEDIDYYTYEFVHDKISPLELFEAFKEIFTLKYVFKYYYLFILTIKRSTRRKVLSDTLYKQLGLLRYKQHNMIIGLKNFVSLFERMTSTLENYLVGLIKKQKLPKRAGLHPNRLYQFYRSVKNLILREAITLKYLDMYLTNEESLHIIQKAFFMDLKSLEQWYALLPIKDLLVAYFYFYLVGLKANDKPIKIKFNCNPNLVKMFYRIHEQVAFDANVEIDSEEEDYLFIEKQQEKLRRDEAQKILKEETQRKKSESMNDFAIPPDKRGTFNQVKDQWGEGFEKTPGLQFNDKGSNTKNNAKNNKKSKKNKSHFTLQNVPEPKKNVFEKDSVNEGNLDNAFDFPGLEGPSSLRQKTGQVTYKNKHTVDKELKESFPSLGGGGEIFNPDYTKSKHKKKKPNKMNNYMHDLKSKDNKFNNQNKTVNANNNNNMVKMVSKKKNKKNKIQKTEKSWSDNSSTFLMSKHQKKKIREKDFPTFDTADNQANLSSKNDITSRFRGRVLVSRTDKLEEMYGDKKGNPDVDYIKRAAQKKELDYGLVHLKTVKGKGKKRRKGKR